MIDPGVPTIPLSLALAGLMSPTRLRDQVEWAASLGFRALQLNAAAPGTRPRELGRSARRDIAGMLRRNELSLSGIDLWIPPAHFLDPARADHAMSAVSEAIEFTSEMATLIGGNAVLSLALPADRDSSRGVVRSLEDKCQSVGVRIADFTWPPAPLTEALSPIGVGVDPAGIFAAGRADPPAELLRLGGRLAAARLSDISSSGRVAPGEGRLDLLSYVVAASTASGALPLVMDLRGFAEPERIARHIFDQLAG